MEDTVEETPSKFNTQTKSWFAINFIKVQYWLLASTCRSTTMLFLKKWCYIAIS